MPDAVMPYAPEWRRGPARRRRVSAAYRRDGRCGETAGAPPTGETAGARRQVRILRGCAISERPRCVPVASGRPPPATPPPPPPGRRGSAARAGRVRRAYLTKMNAGRTRRRQRGGEAESDRTDGTQRVRSRRKRLTTARSSLAGAEWGRRPLKCPPPPLSPSEAAQRRPTRPRRGWRGRSGRGAPAEGGGGSRVATETAGSPRDSNRRGAHQHSMVVAVPVILGNRARPLTPIAGVSTSIAWLSPCR